MHVPPFERRADLTAENPVLVRLGTGVANGMEVSSRFIHSQDANGTRKQSIDGSTQVVRGNGIAEGKSCYLGQRMNARISAAGTGDVDGPALNLSEHVFEDSLNRRKAGLDLPPVKIGPVVTQGESNTPHQFRRRNWRPGLNRALVARMQKPTITLRFEEQSSLSKTYIFERLQQKANFMKTVQSIAAIVCVMLILAPVGAAQQRYSYSWQSQQYSWFTDPYKAKSIPPVYLDDSDRAEKLLRAGKLYLSLNDAIALALENNLDIELQRYGPQIAQADLLRAEAGGLLRGVPQTVQTGPGSVEAQVTGTGQGTGVATGGGGGAGGDTGTTTTEAGGAIITQTGVATPVLDPRFFFRYSYGHRSSLQSNTVTTGATALLFDNHTGNMGFEKNWLTGTTASFGWNSNYFQSNNYIAVLNPSISSNFQLQITQRLLQGFGRAVNDRNIRIAKNNVRVTDLVFEQQVIATVSSAVKLYWDLVAFAEDVKVKQQALALAEKLFNDNKKQVEIGTLAPIEIVSAEAQVARRLQELTASETRLLQQETVIKNTLSKNGVESPLLASARVIATDRINIPPQEPLRPISDLMATAFASRREVEQTRINIENSRIGMAGSKSALLPSLDLQAFFNNNGLAGEQNYLGIPGVTPPADPYFLGGFGESMGMVLRRNFPDYGVAFQLSIPIRNRSAQADYVRDALQLRQSELRERRQLNSIRVQVQNAQIVMTQARALYDAALKERALQEQTLDAEQKKYALGASTVFFVIQYQRDLAQAQSNEVAALATYAKARVDLDVALGKVLETHNIKIDEALAGKVSRPADPIPAIKE